MYLKTKGAQQHIIKDLYQVWLPPIPKNKADIIGFERKKSDQFWRRTPLPLFYEERRGEEKARQDKERELVQEGVISRIKYFDPVLENYRRAEWYKRIYGVYFMNNGKPIYLTGTHYTFLQWCKLDHPENDGYPLFYMPQLDRFYFRQLCMEDPFTLGYLIIAPRGAAKTSEEVACQLENMTKPGHNRYAAIQSKSKEDAEQVVFQEKMVPMFNSWPDFFKPEHSHGSDPKNKMVFRQRSVRGEEAKFVKHGPDFELGSMIVCVSSHNKALDGKTISDEIVDEIGKLNPEINQDAYTRHSVNVRTVWRNQRKRGLIRATTTVEEMEQGGDECHQIWIESDPNIRDGNGYTTSKLYRLFISALDTQTDLANIYGEIPKEEALVKILNEREPVKDDNYKLSLLMRKNPLTEEEAFLKPQSDCIYDVMILSKRLSELKMMKGQKPGRRYQLEWVNGVVDGDVELVEHKEGPFTLFFEPDKWWTKTRKLLNACDSYTNDNGKKLWLPVNNDLFRSSCDPVKYVKTSDPRASKMAGHGMMKYIPDLDMGKDLNEWISHNIMWEYYARHTDPVDDYENIIKAMRFFGHSIMPEQNAGEFMKHLHSRGYEKFVILRKHFDFSVLMNKFSKNKLSGENAVHSNTEVIESYVKRTAAFIRRHGHRLNSIPLIEQLLKFDPKKPTLYDLAVSFGFAILSMEADLDDYFRDQQYAERVINYFAQFDMRGTQSKLITAAGEGGDDDGSYDFNDDLLNHYMLGR